ncbi:hypothetical protein GJAV_G00135010 [Gymnothorax javanicus]|nr:hypothetical protein GJAV_G00135010 [Gymnothorax javanicus]
MDSLDFHLERVSKLDVHPLSYPMSRLSPAKSTSSIDQFTHHHGKGDSAYSSFSGGSNAPDYSSPFMPEEVNPHSLQYTDLKYVQAVYHPDNLNSSPKSMERLYRSMEAISQQFDQRDSFMVEQFYNQESFPPPPVPPHPPSHLDSFITARNLENSRGYQNPEDQQLEMNVHHQSLAASLNVAVPKTGPIYGRRISQPNLRNPMGQDKVNQVPEPQKPASAVIRSSPVLTLQEGLKQQSIGRASQIETQKPRRHSVQGTGCSEQVHAWSTQQGTPTVFNGSIQHKGPFYFVTGVCKPPEPSFKGTLGGVQEQEEELGSQEYPPRMADDEKRRSHSTVQELLRNIHHKRQGSQDSQTERAAFLQNQDLRSRIQHKELHRSVNALFPSSVSNQGSQSFDDLDEQSQNVQGKELGFGSRHHSSSYPIFYCGPEDQLPLANSSSNESGLSLPSLDPVANGKTTDQAKRGMRQLFEDVAKEKISKETTPLLYHLAGESRGVLAHMSKSNSDPNENWKESRKNTLPLSGQSTEHPTYVEEETSNMTTPSEESRDKIEMPADSYNTLDESFKKYYKEKLKDAQSKVLWKTSFKRKDLQLSWPNKIRQKPEKRPSVLPLTSSSLYSSETTESSVLSGLEVLGGEGGMDNCKENFKDSAMEFEKVSSKEGTMECAKESGEDSREEHRRQSDGECKKESSKYSCKDSCLEMVEDDAVENVKENGRPPNIAQPQVPRKAGRKRLTQEQKKMCYSEPGKLNQLGVGPNHTTQCSLGSEEESMLSMEDQREQGLVAARKMVFETRGRARSTSCLSRATLKEVRHKALVAYMERKTGHRTVETQELALRTPGHRHSMSGRPSDSDPRPLSGNIDPRKKLLRPLSAGRILDSSSSSVRYSQFACPPAAHTRLSSRKDSVGSAQEKSASAESLLDQPDPPEFFRARSISTPLAFRPVNNIIDVSPEGALQRASSTKKAEGAVPASKTRTGSVSEVQHSRLVAPRGKSMEELGEPHVSQPPVLSKSSDQLDQLRTRSVREKKVLSFLKDVLEKPQGWSSRKSSLKQDSDPKATSSEVRAITRSPAPATPPTSSPRGRAQSVSERMGKSIFYSETPLPRPTPPKTGESPALPSPPKGSSESDLRIRKTPSPHSLLMNLSAKDREVTSRSDSPQEVSLSSGVTTDPTSWLTTQETDPATPASLSPPDDANAKEAPSNLLLEGDSRATTPAVVATAETSSATESTPMRNQREVEGVGSEVGQKTGEQLEVPAIGAEETEPRWEELVEEVVAKDQSLARVLCPVSNRKTAVMLMEQLLTEDALLMEEHYRKKKQEVNNTQQAGDRSNTKVGGEKLISSTCENPGSDTQGEEALQTPSKTGSDVTKNKRLLCSHIEGRLQALESERAVLQEEVQANAAQGEAVDALVRGGCLPAEYERYTLFIGDLERVVNLLLCLSARLARVQNALSTVDQNTDAEERKSLDSRHALLCKQRDDAKDLKDNLDRRERVVSDILSKYLSPDQLREYRHFIQSKAAILIRQKDLEERQRLWEEQLESLLNSIPP